MSGEIQLDRTPRWRPFDGIDRGVDMEVGPDGELVPRTLMWRKVEQQPLRDSLHGLVMLARR